MKKKLAAFIRTILFLLILLCAFFGVVLLVERKESYVKNAAFFEEAKKDHLDVLFLGSSHVINGINPAVLYEDYGITSYNLGGHGSLMQESYWQLKRALGYCRPKYVVVDAYMLEKNYKYLDKMYENSSDEDRKTSIEQLHLNMDAYPLSKIKIDAVNDLISDKDLRREFLFDYIIYHSRWNDLTKNDFKRLSGKADTNKLMGAEMRYAVKTDVDEYEKVGEGEILQDTTVCEEYLMKIIEECKNEDIGLVITYIPFSATVDDQIAANSASRIAADYDVPCLNMLDGNVIDEVEDLNDHGHLNVSGAKKVTDYVGAFLAGTGEFTDHRGDEGYSEWDDVAAAYESELDNHLLAAGNIKEELSFLTFDKYNTVLFIAEGSPALGDDGICHLIANLAGSDTVYSAKENGGPYVLIRDKNAGQVYESAGYNVLEGMNTALGELVYVPVEKKFRLLYSTSNEELNYLYDDVHFNEDIWLIIYDDNGEIRGQYYYTTLRTDYLKSE